MDDIDRYIPLILFALNGLIAGWLATRIFGGLGFFRNLVIGILGSLLAGYAIRAGIIKAPAILEVPMIDQLIYSTLGAIVVLLLARFVARR